MPQYLQCRKIRRTISHYIWKYINPRRRRRLASQNITIQTQNQSKTAKHWKQKSHPRRKKTNPREMVVRLWEHLPPRLRPWLFRLRRGFCFFFALFLSALVLDARSQQINPSVPQRKAVYASSAGSTHPNEFEHTRRRLWRQELIRFGETQTAYPDDISTRVSTSDKNREFNQQLWHF